VLAILLLHANEAVSPDRLVEDLWSGRPSASAATSLQAHVSRLRRALGDDRRIVTTGSGYLIRVTPGELDRERFERQRDLVAGEIDRLGALAAAVDAAIEAQRTGTKLKETNMFEGFDPTEYEDEARERWGHTDAYRESARRTKAYGEVEWKAVRAESDAIVRESIELMRAGEPSDGPAARALAERHRGHISRWFYPCSWRMHGGLGEMYIADARFTSTYERQAEGLAAYLHDAIVANADAQEQAEVSR
jgi:MerR family transcriptional regulator, thiopeptide resistance regulator